MHTRPIVDCFPARRTSKNTVLNRCAGFQVEEWLQFGVAEQQCSECPIQVHTKEITASVLWGETRYQTQGLVYSPFFDGNTAAEVSISWGVKKSPSTSETSRHSPHVSHKYSSKVLTQKIYGGIAKKASTFPTTSRLLRWKKKKKKNPPSLIFC